MKIEDLIKHIEEAIIVTPSGNCPFCNSKMTVTSQLHPKDAIEHYGYYNFGLYQLKDTILDLAKKDLEERAEKIGQMIMEVQRLQKAGEL